jgi:hypothetical protein
VPSLDYAAARAVLASAWATAAKNFAEHQSVVVPAQIDSASADIFGSGTQAYREALLGCVLARIQSRAINVRLPYMNQGPDAFNGRTLDEQVVNPFLSDNRIPSSRGPYLGVFRRSVRFDESTRKGLRDKPGYNAFLTVLSFLEKTDDEAALAGLLTHLLMRFLILRESADVALSRLQRMSLKQYDQLIAGLLETPSGGRIPVLLVVAAFTAIRANFNLKDWEISSGPDQTRLPC